MSYLINVCRRQRLTASSAGIISHLIFQHFLMSRNPAQSGHKCSLFRGNSTTCRQRGFRCQRPDHGYGYRSAGGSWWGSFWATRTTATWHASRLKRAEAVLDDAPLLSDDDLWLDAFHQRLLPPPDRRGSGRGDADAIASRQGAAPGARDTLPQPMPEHTLDIDALQKRAPRQAELLQLLRDESGNGIDTDSLTETLPNWRRAAKPLFEKGLITHFERRAETHSGDNSRGTPSDPGPKPNTAQQNAIDAVQQCRRLRSVPA